MSTPSPCQIEGMHCYCLQAQQHPRRKKPHVECCNCGHLKLDPQASPRDEFRPQMTGWPTPGAAIAAGQASRDK